MLRDYLTGARYFRHQIAWSSYFVIWTDCYDQKDTNMVLFFENWRRQRSYRVVRVGFSKVFKKGPYDLGQVEMWRLGGPLPDAASLVRPTDKPPPPLRLVS